MLFVLASLLLLVAGISSDNGKCPASKSAYPRRATVELVSAGPGNLSILNLDE